MMSSMLQEIAERPAALERTIAEERRKLARLFLASSGTILIVLFSARSVFACEPILPLAQVFGGPWLITRSLLGLGLAILLKLAAFVYFERSISWRKAVAYMFIANVVSSGVGVVAMFPFAAPTAFFIGIPLLYFMSVLPAKQLVKKFNPNRKKYLNHYVVSFFIVALFLTSVIFWGLSQGAANQRSFGWYWALKLAYIYIALILSLGLTILYEEWVVSWLSKRKGEVVPFLTSVTRANLVTMLFVMTAAAIMILPARIRSPEFIGIIRRTIAYFG